MNNNFDKHGIEIASVKNVDLLNQCRSLVDEKFSKSTEFYNKMDREEFQSLVLNCQKIINKNKFIENFFKTEKSTISKVIGEEEICVESVVFLRAVRPAKKENSDEHPDFHRETFYCDDDYMKHVINIWMPLKNVDERNTLQYIPFSHKIPDNEIKTSIDNNWPGKVEKYSSGHKIGFFWSPKKITNGVNLTKAKKILFKKNTYCLFSSLLIHGGARNMTESIRFALGFGIIPKNRLDQNKKFFASGGKDHFIPLASS